MVTKPKPKRKSRTKYFNCKIPITGARGFKATEVLFYTGADVDGKKYSIFMIPEGGLTEIEVVEDE